MKGTRLGKWLFLLMLAACQSAEPPQLQLQPVPFEALPGWDTADPAPALNAFRLSCARNGDALPQLIGGVAVDPAAWSRACAAAGDAQDAVTFFRTYFRPWLATASTGSDTALLTGYYEPLLQGDLNPGERFRHPVWALPRDLSEDTPYLTREQIDREGLQDRAEPLLWVDDPIDLFFLQVQGSGRVRLPDGSLRSLAFAGRNGHPYRSIGKVLIEKNEIPREQMSMQALKSWLHAHPERMQEILWQNPSYIFFRFNDASGPVGSQGAVLTPEASLAVDPKQIPYGLPVWLDTTLPPAPEIAEPHIAANETGSFLWQALTGESGHSPVPDPYRRLAIAQDSGSAITGPLRGDLFFGHGRRAEALAGRMQQAAQLYLLLPALP